MARLQVAELTLNDQQLLRYSRHILLDAIGIDGQARILDSHILIVGAGGLGSPAAVYLASAGVGHLTLADGDTVDFTNLQRQILHHAERVGQNKAVSGKTALMAINPEIRVDTLPERLAGVALETAVSAADVVLDCTDNFVTRHALNRACVRQGKPLVSGAAIGFDGQVSVYDRRDESSPCYHCLFPDSDDVAETRCALLGVFAPLTGMVGSMQAAEALKLIAGIGKPLVGRLLLLDALSMQWRTVTFRKDPACPVCGDLPPRPGVPASEDPRRSSADPAQPTGACSQA